MDDNHPNLSPDQKTTRIVRDLIARGELEEAPFTSLGTPYVGLDAFTREIIHLGNAAVEPLIELLPKVSARGAASAAYCLGKLGEPSAIPVLKETLAQYEAKPVKTPDDYAFIGNARTAVMLLTSLPDTCASLDE